MLRWLLGLTWKDRVKNGDIRKRVKVGDIEEKVRENRLSNKKDM